MSLVDWDEDDKALLEAEDQAIRDADKQPEEVRIPTGPALSRLIEDALNAGNEDPTR